jgi:hypothetical protein
VGSGHLGLMIKISDAATTLACNSGFLSRPSPLTAILKYWLPRVPPTQIAAGDSLRHF